MQQKHFSTYRTCLVTIVITLITTLSWSQTKEQQQLEQQRTKLLQQITQIRQLLFQQGSERKSVVSQVEDLNRKIKVREELIKVTNRQANLLSREINANQTQIESLKKELVVLKEDYAKMIRQSYKSKSQESRLMFLLSSEDFSQAFKRMQYMKQYRAHRKKQGLTIQTKTEELKKLNEGLIVKRKDKEQLIAENRSAQETLKQEKIQQEELIASIRQKEGEYTAQIRTKEKEAKDLQNEIDRLIREAIAENNKKSGVKATDAKSTTKFALTPEGKAIASSFAGNKGKLIWPVEKGVVSRGFGEYHDPVYPGLTLLNNGVTIATETGAEARAIFEGEVTGIMAIGNKYGVQVRHGNYLSVYSNLSAVYVKKGQKITRKQALGKILTNASTSKTELKFFLYKDTEKLNPEQWIYQM